MDFWFSVHTKTTEYLIKLDYVYPHYIIFLCAVRDVGTIFWEGVL